MAGPSTHHSPIRDPFSGGEDEHARGLPERPIKSNNTPTSSLAISRAPTAVPVPTPTPTPPSTNELFKQLIKAYMESNQELSQPPTQRKQLFKAKVLDVYYGKLHIDCYYFC